MNDGGEPRDMPHTQIMSHRRNDDGGPGVWVGGTNADGVVDGTGFDLVVCCAPVKVVGWKRVVSHVFPDDWLGGFSTEEKRAAVAAAREVDAARERRENILICCREGRNRSCLVAVLVLALDGCMLASEALDYVRERRKFPNGKAVSNSYFESFILSGEWVSFCGGRG